AIPMKIRMGKYRVRYSRSSSYPLRGSAIGGYNPQRFDILDNGYLANQAHKGPNRSIPKGLRCLKSPDRGSEGSFNLFERSPCSHEACGVAWADCRSGSPIPIREGTPSSLVCGEGFGSRFVSWVLCCSRALHRTTPSKRESNHGI